MADVRALAVANDASDADLVGRARDGDRWAEELLFRRHVKGVGATAMRLLHDATEAEDVIQETFALAFEELHKLREPAMFKPWLLRIAVSRVHRVFRRQRFWRLLGRDDAPIHTLADLASADLEPDARLELRLLDEELRRLPAEERIAWTLRRVEGMELREVADACACSLATAKRRIAAADARVRRHSRSGRQA